MTQNRCADCYTRNAAESFHISFWNFIPKNTFVGNVPLNICKSFSLIVYNKGYQKLQDLFSKLGLYVAKLTVKTLVQRDHNHIYI